MKKEEPTILTNLYHFCEIFLREDHSKEMGKFSYLAEAIDAKLRKENTCLFYIQWADKEGDLIEPVLWSYPAWKESVELIERQRAWSEEQRVKRYILDENIKRVSLKCQKEFLMDENHATMLALSLVKNQKVTAIKAIGGKLITKKEEI